MGVSGTREATNASAALGVVPSGYAQVTADQTGISTEADVTSLTITWTAVSTRRYRITGHLLVQQLTSTGAATAKITDGSGTEIQRIGHRASFAANDVDMWEGSSVETGLSGSITRKIRAATSAGTLSALASSSRPNYILVEDIGPA